MNEKNEKQLMQVQMPRILLDKAKEKSRKNDLTLSVVVRNLLTEYVENPQAKLIF